MDVKSTIAKTCNPKIEKMKSSDVSPSTHTLDVIRMFARVYTAKDVELHADSINC